MLLLYSGGLDTSVMLKWIQDQYEAEVVALTVDLGQPGEDFEVVRDKALRLGALDCLRRRRQGGVRARLRAAGDQGERALRRRLSALHRARPAADREARGREGARDRLRHDRARLHRQGQRPGPDRGDRGGARPRAEDHRAGARLADGARGGDRLRARARHSDQGRDRGAAVLGRRQHLGALLRGRADRGPLRAGARRRVRDRHAAGAGARRGRSDRDRVRARLPGRARRRAARPGRADRARGRDRRAPRRRHRRPHRGPDRRPQGARHLRGAGGAR